VLSRVSELIERLCDPKSHRPLCISIARQAKCRVLSLRLILSTHSDSIGIDWLHKQCGPHSWLTILWRIAIYYTPHQELCINPSPHHRLFCQGIPLG
jgi:hypothetical protein